VIQRPQTNTPAEFNKFTGKPSNDITTVGKCTGFISCTDIHPIGCSATESEMNEILSLLKAGILI
jgi:hypothetical protein